MKTRNIALVAVENTVFHFDKAFSYLIPERFSDLSAGFRVSVPFGRGNQRRQAMILEIKECEDDSGLKEIFDVLDDERVLDDEMIALARFMKSYCFCTYYDAIKTMLPAGLNYRLSVSYSVKKGLGDAVFDLDDESRRIVSLITSKRNLVSKEDLMRELGLSDDGLLEKLCGDGVLEKKDSSSRRLKDKTVKMARLSDDFDEKVSRIKLTQKQQNVLDTLSSVGAVSVKELCYYSGVTASVADSLEKKGLLVYFDDEVFRIPKTTAVERKQVTLTEEQQQAFDELDLLRKKDSFEVSLLYGITGSGKTSVFFKLIEATVDEGKDVIVMVPEIALTPQLVAMFKAHFGEKVAVFHSALSSGERLDEYKRAKKGLAKIAIGTRSAVFAPFSNLGLVIMDEEQEHTYKNESKPRFHSRDLAKFRCYCNKALLLLSSATPSMESFYHAERGDYHRQTLRHRYGNATLPDVIIADMNEELQEGNASSFSKILLENIEENLNTGKQSILLLNRRGYNTFVTCNSCKEPITCPNCSITLTYHSANNRLMCHYCGYSQSYTPECPSCHSHSLRFSGAGTQRAEIELQEIFPGARVLRMDADSTMSRSAFEKKLSAFANGEFDIMVGTQMVAKGLDFENVTLVGVLNADRTLYLDDYRGFENAFSLLTQVVGRAGRGKKKGRAIIQTYTPENPVISLAAKQDYDAFYHSEIGIRKALLYPPFSSMCMIGFVSDDGAASKNAAFAFLEMMTALLKEQYPDIPLRVLGPAPAAVFKVSNKYRFKLILKCRNDARFREMLSLMLERFGAKRDFSSVTVYADMHPLSF